MRLLCVVGIPGFYANGIVFLLLPENWPLCHFVRFFCFWGDSLNETMHHGSTLLVGPQVDKSQAVKFVFS